MISTKSSNVKVQLIGFAAQTLLGLRFLSNIWLYLVSKAILTMPTYYFIIEKYVMIF